MNGALHTARAGWTLIELAIASVLVTAVLGKAALLVRASLDLAGDESASMHYEDQARAVIDRIALAVMGAEREKLKPQIQELHSNSVRYTFSLGVEDGSGVNAC